MDAHTKARLNETMRNFPKALVDRVMERAKKGGRDPFMLAAIEIAGGPAEMARICGISRQGVDLWKKVPPIHVITIEKETGVSRHDLRPDIYPREVE